MFNVTVSSFSDLDWLSQLPEHSFNIMRYTNDEELEESKLNIPLQKGYEATIYLKSIIDNYDNLTENNVFIHGCEYSDYHSGSMVDLIQNNVFTNKGYTNINKKYLKSVYNQHFDYFIENFYNKVLSKYIGSHKPFGDWHDGAKGYSQFIVTKEQILSKPLQMYVDLLEWIKQSDYGERIEERDIEAKFLEWSWNIIFEKSPLYQESLCKYVSIRGIAGLCDKKPNRDILSDQDNFDLTDYNNIEDYDTVFVPTLDLKRFLNEVFYVQNKKIILVTGCCVKSVPIEICKLQNIDRMRLLTSPNLIHWFTQNCDKPSKKVSSIPLGIDFHTLNRGDHKWGLQSCPQNQEKQLISLIPSEHDYGLKANELYSNFHFVRDRYNDRKTCIEYIQKHDSIKNMVYFENEYTTREHAWVKHKAFAFCLSPLGMGLDCHRTWEAMVLKSIPIVRTSSLKPMLEHLPVIQVNSWNELTQELLERYYKQFASFINTNTASLELSYWMDEILSKKQHF